MSNPRKIFSLETQSNGFSLLLTWLLLVVLPGIFFIHFFARILNNEENHLREIAKIRLMAEIEKFQQDLSGNALIEEKLNHFAGDSSISRLFSSDAEETRRKLEQKLGFPILGCFLKNSKQQVSFSLLPSQKRSFLVSRTMLGRLFKSLELQHVTNLKDSENEELEKLHSRSRAFLKSLFKTIGEMKLENGQVLMALSGKPELKKLYFLYLKIPHAEPAPLSMILVVRDLDIPIKKIMQFAMRRNQNPAIARSYALRHFPDTMSFNRMKQTISIFNERDDALEFYAPFPSALLNRIICRGTYYPFRLQETLENFPLLKTSLGKNRFSHPLQRFTKPFTAACKLGVMLVSLVFLRLYLFGAQLPFKIRSKIMIALAFVSILPFTTLYLMAGFHENFRQNFTRFEIVNLLNQQVDEFNIAVNSFRSNLENQNAELCEKLNRLEDYEFVPFLNHWLQERPVSQIFTRIKRNNGFIGRSSKEKIHDFEHELKDLLFTCVENTFRHKREDGSVNDGEMGLFRLKVKGIGAILANMGLIHNSNFTNLDELYTVVPAFAKNDPFNGINAVFMLKYNSRLILADFFAGQPNFLNTEEKAGFRIQKCYIPISNQAELPIKESFIAKPGFPRQKVLNLVRKILVGRSEETEINQSENKLEVIHAEYSNNLNCIVVLLAQQLSQDQFSILPGIRIIAAYSLLIFITIVFLMGKFFVEPVKLLQISAEANAAGDFEHQIVLDSGDEFANLATAFNNMTRGLDQREKMTSFVSESVLHEVSESSELILEPGGEKAQVSILFCSLPDLKKYFSPENTDTLLNHLGQLIDITDAISRKHNGIIDKIIEDTVMIVFRQRDAENGHVVSACKAALEISAAFPNSQCPLRISAGIASGAAISGKVGSKEGKLDFTVIGNPVNLAARLKAQAFMADTTGILLCPQTIRMLKGAGKVRFHERVEIKGRTRTFPMYELLDLRA